MFGDLPQFSRQGCLHKIPDLLAECYILIAEIEIHLGGPAISLFDWTTIIIAHIV